MYWAAVSSVHRVQPMSSLYMRPQLYGPLRTAKKLQRAAQAMSCSVSALLQHAACRYVGQYRYRWPCMLFVPLTPLTHAWASSSLTSMASRKPRGSPLRRAGPLAG